ERFETLAERLAALGYETMGVSENPWLTARFGMTQGFERFVAVDPFRLGVAGPSLPEVVHDWLRTRSSRRPFFLFVNIMDAHESYPVRDSNRFLPAGVSPAQARTVSQRAEDYLCHKEPRDADLAVLRALYLDGVAAADAKLGTV